MPSAAVKRYWNWLPDECPCGRVSEHVHHVIHVNHQRITKDDMLVCKLCRDCHDYLHSVGGDERHAELGAFDTLKLAVLRRHNFEVKHA